MNREMTRWSSSAIDQFTTHGPVPASDGRRTPRQQSKIGPMHLRDRHRFRIALMVIVCLLFQQVAMAAYACPLERMPADPAAMVADCAGMDMEHARQSPVLCAKHCTPDRTVATDHAALSVPALALPPLAFGFAFAQPVSRVALVAGVPVDRSDPPPRLRYCSLLI